MNSTKLITLLVIGILCVNARVVKRQRKIARILPKKSSTCSCQLPIREIPKQLLESAYTYLGTCGCPNACDCPNTCDCPSGYGCPNGYDCPNGYGCPNNCGCPNSCGCPNGYGCQNVFLEELPCGCNYECTCIDTNCNRIPNIRPNTLVIDASVSVPTNMPLYKCDVPNCQCQNSLPYKMLESPCSMSTYELSNLPIESMIQPLFMETPRTVVKPTSCGCQRQKCGCQLLALDVPCSCQMPGLSCGSTLSDVPCNCQLPAFNLPCGCQLPSLDCGCQFQAYNTPCSCLNSPCGCQLPVPNIPYAYQLPALDCGCQLSSCGCLPPPVIGCTKYLRQVTLQPPFL